MEIIVKKQTSAVIVLYNPSINEIIQNLSLIIDQVDKIYLVDNSDISINESIFNHYKSVLYISNGGNKGIANALNVGADFAIKDKYKWLLMLDQDSKVPANMIIEMLSFYEKHQSFNIGIIAPNVKLFNEHLPKIKNNEEYIEVTTAITSGSLLNLEVYKKVGNFDENLFIDQVDHEYCLRLKLNNYKTIFLQNICIEHKLGDTFEVKLFGKHFVYVTNHNYMRRYYMTRNSLYIYSVYKHYFPKISKTIRNNIIKDFLKIIIFEKNKRKKIKSIYFGMKDFYMKKMGKYKPTN